MTCDATTFFVEDEVRVTEGEDGEEGFMYIGAHVNSSGGVWKAVANGVDIGCEAIQFFAGSPRTWAPTLYKDEDAAKFREARAESPIRFCLLYTSDAADDLLCVDLGGRRIIKKKKK